MWSVVVMKLQGRHLILVLLALLANAAAGHLRGSGDILSLEEAKAAQKDFVSSRKPSAEPSAAIDPKRDLQSVRVRVGGCSGTRYGCCPNGITACNSDCSNCPANNNNILTLGGCSGTRFGCCPNGVTACNSACSNCPGNNNNNNQVFSANGVNSLLQGCINSEFGCWIKRKPNPKLKPKYVFSLSFDCI